MESISVFDIIKVGIGPSSSHTMGPWEAALQFCRHIQDIGKIEVLNKIKVYLYGSLAKTGKGHGTDFAVTLGLAGYDFKKINTDILATYYQGILMKKTILFAGQKELSYIDVIEFHPEITLEGHPNGIKFEAYFEDQFLTSKTYHSIGGGFIKEEGVDQVLEERIPSKFPCHTGADILSNCNKLGLKISDLVLLNEQSWLTESEIKDEALHLWEEMKSTIWRGCQKDGILPGNLGVQRRAKQIFGKLSEGIILESPEEWIAFLNKSSKDFNTVNKWVSVFALAVNEENAAYGRVVTAPTNGAAGVLPAVLMYAKCFLPDINDHKIIQFILTAGEIGTLFKKSATISAAMGGCQAEIGVSSAMAAAALTEIIGGSNEQVLMAAEIAMEHHLGLTCDPIGGLVQIPCIERNTMGAIKAITASNIALESNPNNAKVSLDAVIETMWQTALDMNSKYKETSEGGLAANISVNIAEC